MKQQCSEDIIKTTFAETQQSVGNASDMGQALINLSKKYATLIDPNATNIRKELQQYITTCYQNDDSIFETFIGHLPCENGKTICSSLSVAHFTVPFIADANIRQWIRKSHSRIPKFAPTLWKLRKSPDVSIIRYNVEDSSKSQLNTYRVRLNRGKNEADGLASLYILALHGNGGCALEILENTLQTAQKLITSEEPSIRSVEVISFDYRGSVASPGPYGGLEDLSKQVVDQIHLLLKENILSERICMYSHSLGGLIGVMAAAELIHNAIPVNYFGDRVPNSIDEVLSAALPAAQYIPAFFRQKIVLRAYQHDAALYYLKLPPTHRTCLASKADSVIPFPASLVGILQSKHSIDEGIVVEKMNHTWQLASLANDPLYTFCLEIIHRNEPTIIPTHNESSETIESFIY